MRKKFVTRVVTGALALAMVCTTLLANPVNASAAITRDVIVSNQKQLNRALKLDEVKNITIKTNKAVTLKIGNLVLGDKTLSVNAPKSKIDSKADFKKIMIKDGASFIDRGAGNSIIVNDRNIFKLVVGKQADGTKITINSKGGDITVVGNGDIARINVKGKSDVTVRGKSDRAPKIVNNAEGASISTAMNASVSLNKPAELIVKAGAKITSLNVKAASDISVAAGATVDAVKVSADKVNLKVDGTVAKVAVNSKADVAISGSTKNTIEVTNNAAGSNVQTSVKTDLKLNADAKISLDKGAEGSSVKVEKEGVKPSVENKTSADVTIKDAKGTDSTIAAEKTDADEKPSSEDKGAEESSVKEEKEGVKPSTENKTSADDTIKDAKDTDSTIADGKTDADEKPSSEDKGAEGSSVKEEKEEEKPSSEDKGAEGASVKEEKEGEKPSSEDKGDGSSSGDSSGSESGGSSTPSTPPNPSVTKPVLKLESDVADRSYLKANDTLTANVENAGSDKVTYQWQKNSTPISGATSANYTIKSEDEGSRITVTVIVTAGDGQRYSLTSEETDYIWKAVHVRFKNSITVEHGTTAANLKEFLNDKYNEVSLGTAADSEIVSGAVAWDVTDGYNGDIAGDYTVTGTATAPKYYYFAEEAAAKVTCKVTVKQEGALKVIGKKVDADVSGDSTCAANQKIFDVSMKGETIVISGYYAKAARDASNQVGFVLELSADGATDLRWSKDGKTERGLMKENDLVYVQLDLKEYLDTPKAIYVKDGDSGDYTPVYIQVDAKILDIYVMAQKPYKTTLEARTFPNVGTVEDLKLPTEVIFCADQDEKDFPISITWACDKAYGKEGAGIYTFYPTLGEKPAYTQVYLYGLDPIHIELKMVEKPSA